MPLNNSLIHSQNVTDEVPTNNLPTSTNPVFEHVDQQKHSKFVEVPVPVDQTQERVLNDDVKFVICSKIWGRSSFYTILDKETIATT